MENVSGFVVFWIRLSAPQVRHAAKSFLALRKILCGDLRRPDLSGDLSAYILARFFSGLNRYFQMVSKSRSGDFFATNDFSRPFGDRVTHSTI